MKSLIKFHIPIFQAIKSSTQYTQLTYTGSPYKELFPLNRRVISAFTKHISTQNLKS